MEAGIPNFGLESQSSNQQERIAALQIENSTLRADLGRWKQLHQAAKEREHELLKALQDSKAQVAYLKKQLYEKKSEQASKKPETVATVDENGKTPQGPAEKAAPSPHGAINPISWQSMSPMTLIRMIVRSADCLS